MNRETWRAGSDTTSDHGANRKPALEEQAGHGASDRPELTGCPGDEGYHPARVAGTRVKRIRLTTRTHARPMMGETKRE